MSKIHLLSDSSIEWLKQQAKLLKKSNSISQSQALHEIAIQQGFASWKELLQVAEFEKRGIMQFVIENSDDALFERFKADYIAGKKLTLDYVKNNFAPLIAEHHTDLQLIGAIARSIGRDPRKIKNTIHLVLGSSDEVFSLTTDEWESLGLYRDFEFAKQLEKFDPYFENASHDFAFRLLSVDTCSHAEVYEFLKEMHNKTRSIIPLATENIWINGKIDPIDLAPDPDYPDELLPLPQLPEIVWKAGY